MRNGHPEDPRAASNMASGKVAEISPRSLLFEVAPEVLRFEGDASVSRPGLEAAQHREVDRVTALCGSPCIRQPQLDRHAIHLIMSRDHLNSSFVSNGDSISDRYHYLGLAWDDRPGILNKALGYGGPDGVQDPLADQADVNIL